MPLGRRTALKYAAAGVSLLLSGCGREPPATSAPPAPRARRALRFELRHTVGEEEQFLLTRLREEPAWAGRSDAQATPPDWGDYRFELTQPDGKVLYGAGFDSAAASGASVALSVRAPYPDTAVQASIVRRRAGT